MVTAFFTGSFSLLFIFFYCHQYRSCPLALEAAMGLLELGQSATEVNSLMTVCLPAIGNLEW